MVPLHGVWNTDPDISYHYHDVFLANVVIYAAVRPLMMMTMSREAKERNLKIHISCARIHLEDIGRQ